MTRPSLASLFPVPFLAALAHGQVWESEVLVDAFFEPGIGFVVDSVGDLDGDGLREALITSIQHSGGRGRVYAVSSGSGATLLDLVGANTGDAFGHSVAEVSDLDGDGVPDIAVGAPASTAGRPGSVSIRSGADGSGIWVAVGENNFDSFGWVVDGAGDLNGDGIEDVLVCAPGHDDPVTDAGKVYALSGTDGSVLWSWKGSIVQEFIGSSVGSAGDVNGDAVADVVVCGMGGGANGRGSATVYSGASGQLIWSVSAGNGARQYGNYFSGCAGDVNADGTPDVYVIDYINVAQRGRLFVYSGVDGTLLHSIRGPVGNTWLFGRVRIGDLNGDGHDDMVVCSAQNDVGGQNAGAVFAFSGATGESLGRWTADTMGRGMGSDCVSIGDIDGDGSQDIMVGVGSGPNGGGGIYILPTNPLAPYSSCAGELNSTGLGGELSYRGSLSLAAQELTLTYGALPANTTVAFFGGPLSASQPTGNGTSCIASPVARVGVSAATASGNGEIAPLIPVSGPAAVMVGSTWHVQAWYRDVAAGGAGFNLTSTLRLAFRP